MIATKVFFALAAIATTVSAAALDVISPPITSPAAGTVWTIGSAQTVTWDTSAIPPSSAGQTAEVVLGFLLDGSIDEHLDLGMFQIMILHHWQRRSHYDIR